MINRSIKRDINIIYMITLVLASCSLFYELLIAQTLTVLASNTVLWYSLTIGLYLASMGIGAFLCERWYKNDYEWKDLFKIEILLSVSGGLSVLFLKFTHSLYIFLASNGVITFGLIVLFSIYVSVVAIIGILTGLELPLLIGLCNKVSLTQKVTNRVLSADYTGSLIGGLIFPLFLLPRFDLLSISYFVALINLSAALFMLFFFIEKIQRRMVNVSIIFLSMYAFIFVSIGFVEPVNQYFMKKEYFYKYVNKGVGGFFKSLKEFPNIEQYRTIYQKIDLVKVPDEHNKEKIIGKFISQKYSKDINFPQGNLLYLNHEFQFHSNKEDVYHEYLAHVPINVHERVPRNILVLGAGDGFLLRELLKYSDVEQITLIELDEQMINLARTHPVFTSINKNSFEDSRVDIKITDAYYYMKNTKEKYDAIYIDLPVPNNYALSKLYSREMFFFLHRSLNNGGYAAFETSRMLIPVEGNGSGNSEIIYQSSFYWDIYYNTIKAAGFDQIIPFFSNFQSKRKVISRAAYDFLDQNAEEWKKKAKEGEDYREVQRQISEVIAEKFLMANRDGFIMMIKGKRPVHKQYANHDISLYVLDAALFQDAFIFSELFEENVDSKKINSIMRPILPGTAFLKTYER